MRGIKPRLKEKIMERRKRRRRRDPWLGFSILLRIMGACVVCCAIFFAMTIFFKIQKITVTGDNPYSDEDVIAASGVQIGENTFFLNKFAAIAKIYQECPYIDTTVMRRHLPSELEIAVTRCVGIAQIEYGGFPYIIDKNGKILGQKTADDTNRYINVLGCEPNTMEIGKYIDFLQKEKEKTLLNVLLMAQKYGIIEQIENVNIEKLYNLTFEYTDRFTVQLGSAEKMEDKFKLLLAVESELASAERGTIDISDTENIRFRPK